MYLTKIASSHACGKGARGSHESPRPWPVHQASSRSPSARLRRLLQYIVEEKLAGWADQTKACSIALSVLRRDESFDPRIDPIVRIEAGRPRRALERSYPGFGPRDPEFRSLESVVDRHASEELVLIAAIFDDRAVGRVTEEAGVGANECGRPVVGDPVVDIQAEADVLET